MRTTRSTALVALLLVAPPLAPNALAADEAAWLGVMLGRPDGAGEPGVTGATVTGVILDSPAARADLRESDLIVAVEGAPVGSPRELVARVQGLAPGSWVTLTVSRRGKELELRPRLTARPDTTERLRPRQGWIGVEAIDLPPALREHFGAPAEAGVMVAHVATASSGEAAGLRLGDVVFSIDGEPVRSSGDLKGRLARAGVGNVVVLDVVRAGAPLALEARIEQVEDQR